MKKAKKILLYIVVSLAAATLLAYATGNSYMVKSALYNFANVDDYKKFDNDTVAIAAPQPIANSSRYNKATLPDSMKAYLQSIETGALLVIKNDSVVFEEYWDAFSADGLSGSFSVAKSITSMLLGIAVQEGHIKSIDDKVQQYLPWFTGGGKENVSIRHLLTMSSGTDFSESYMNPFSITANLYYGNDLVHTANDVTMVNQPGTLHKYKSGDTQLLGLIIEKMTGKKLAQYAAEKLWQPLGATQAALWSTDKAGGNTKAYCCFNTNARDFAKLGQLMLHGGKWNGRQLIDSAYVAASGTACNISDETGLRCHYYGYQWWVSPEHEGVFYARGILGQYIMVIPSQNAVVVRLGKVKSQVLRNATPKIVYDIMNWIPQL
ncbi:MAG: serine hydrolase [Chitinophagaceae bacterium]|nr:serine hydrolase [Chitinophagaceae bacterium]